MVGSALSSSSSSEASPRLSLLWWELRVEGIDNGGIGMIFFWMDRSISFCFSLLMRGVTSAEATAAASSSFRAGMISILYQINMIKNIIILRENVYLFPYGSDACTNELEGAVASLHLSHVSVAAHFPSFTYLRPCRCLCVYFNWI